MFYFYHTPGGIVNGLSLAVLSLAAFLGLPFPDTADLLSKAARRFEKFAENMRAFALKSAPRDRGMRSDDEKDAYWRAITHIVGAK